MAFNFLEELEQLEAQSGSLPLSGNMLALDRITEDPDQPRKTFDEEELNELAASIKERGVIQPISVRPPNSEGIHVIIAGARRYRASRLAGLTEIPAVIRPNGNAADQMIENIQRENLSHSEIGQWVCDQIAAGRKPADLARELGKSRPWISHYARFADLPVEIASLVDVVGMQTANILNEAWRIDTQATQAWISSTDPITQARAAAFKASLQTSPPGDQPGGTPFVQTDPPEVPSDFDPQNQFSNEENDDMTNDRELPDALLERRAQAKSARRSSLPGRALLVECADGSGLLDLDAFPSDPEFGFVHFGDERREMRLAHLTMKRSVANSPA